MNTTSHAVNAAILQSFPAYDASRVTQLLQQASTAFDKKIVVLDDDPTGVQTVNNIFVYTHWDQAVFEEAFSSDNRLFFILTNSRALSIQETTALHAAIAENMEAAAQKTGVDYILISRSDSILRGHYPLETTVLKDTIEANSNKVFDGEIICPFFQEGGRFTLNNIHYVQYGDELIPAGKTEFANDKTFGYSSSDLTEWVAEKSDNAFPAAEVVTVSLEELRNLQVEALTEKLCSLQGFAKLVLNAIEYNDIRVFMAAFFKAVGAGKRFMLRTAAAIPKIMGDVQDIPLLQRNELIDENNTNGGLVVIGSYTQKTTEQFNQLKELKHLHAIAFNSDLYADSDQFATEIQRVVHEAEQTIGDGKTAIVYTKRTPLVQAFRDKEEALKASVMISDGVTSIVGGIRIKPRFIVAKGGITSSEIGTKALQVKKALVLGQVEPGIPVWLTDSSSTFPNMPYIIFPGNVGGPETLKNIVEKIQ